MLVLFVALAAAPATAPAPDKNADPIICERQVVGSEVGTHMRPKKVCMKKSDRDYVDRNTKETLRSINDRGNNPGLAAGRDSTPQ